MCVIDWGSDYVLKPPKEFDPLSPCRVVAPLPRWGGEDIMRGVVRAAHQAHFTGSVEQCEVEIKPWLIAPFRRPFIKELQRFLGSFCQIETL